METLGILFMILAVGIWRQVSVGRAESIPADATLIATAVFQGRWADVSKVMALKGAAPAVATTAVPGASPTNAAGTVGNLSPEQIQESQAAGSSANGLAAIAEAEKLGAAANHRYVWGATGPSSYDCSGLMWRTLQNIGVYKGGRFTTFDFNLIAPKFAHSVKIPAPGDIVNWSQNHMGIVTATDQMYSAYSTKSGIVSSTISDESRRHGTPSYWRLN